MSRTSLHLRAFRVVAVVLSMVVVGMAYLAANFGECGHGWSDHMGQTHIYFFYGWPLVYRRYSLFAGPGARFSQYKYPETLELESSSWPYFIFDMPSGCSRRRVAESAPLLWFAAVLSVAAVVWALTTRHWGWQVSLGNMLLLVFWLGLLQGILRYEWTAASTLHLRQIRAPDAVYVPAIRSAWWLAVLLIFGELSVIYVAGRVLLRWLAQASLRWQAEARADELDCAASETSS